VCSTLAKNKHFLTTIFFCAAAANKNQEKKSTKLLNKLLFIMLALHFVLKLLFLE